MQGLRVHIFCEDWSFVFIQIHHLLNGLGQVYLYLGTVDSFIFTSALLREFRKGP